MQHMWIYMVHFLALISKAFMVDVSTKQYQYMRDEEQYFVPLS